ncbi:MAG: alpha/beta hydrolase, partial [Pseudomonadota bacterium]
MAELPMTQMVERDIVYENGERVAAEEGLMWVPENRNVENSRKIPVHFVRVKAENPTLPPQFYMPGGPGGHFSASNSDEDPLSNNWFKMILEASGGKRDVVFVNQRGNLNVPLSTALNVHIPQRSLSTTTPTQNEADITAKAILETQRHYISKGVDLAGYDIKHLVDDVDAVRQVLGYEKIAFYTLSFGSQWSFSYIATYPAHVDRAVLFGVEPLDHAYDSPAYLDLAVTRVLSEADNSPAAQCMKPEGGFLASVKRSKEKLNKNPKSVTIVNEDGEQIPVLVTGDAFIDMIKGLETGEGYLRSRSAAIPKLVAEVERGEYDNLAKAILTSRSPNNAHMIWALIDNSLGISKERDR